MTNVGSPSVAPPEEANNVDWMPGIEVLRGLAASAVVAFHIWALTTLTAFPGSKFLLGLGVWAVDIFFFLSGFLLVQFFWRPGPRPSIRYFYVRRVFRIAPAYYVSLALLFLILADRNLLYSWMGLRQVVANATFTQWLFSSTASSLNVNGVYWTLSIEMFLYAVLPLLAILIARQPVVVGLLLFMAGMAYRFFVALEGEGLQAWAFGDTPTQANEAAMRLFVLRQFPGILPLFVVGMLLRWWVMFTPSGRHFSQSVRTLSPAVFLALLLPSILLLGWVERASDYRNWLWFAGFDVVICLAAAPAMIYASRPVRESLRWPLRLLAWLGERSYGIYLWHFPIILVVFRRGPLVHPPALDRLWLRILTVVVLTVVLGSLSYRFIERPSRIMGQRLGLRFRTS